MALKIWVGKVTSLLGANGDGFTDIALAKRISIFNKLTLARPENRVASLAARYLHEDRWGGQMQSVVAGVSGRRQCVR